MTLVQHGSSPAFEGSIAPQPAVAAEHEADVVELALDEAADLWRLARQLRQEWRRKRYARLNAA
jgi:hypothetical protein